MDAFYSDKQLPPFHLLLLDRGGDPNKTDLIGSTPLHMAAWNGHRDVVQILLDRGADANMAGYDLGNTPLHNAAINGHKYTVEVLLNGGAKYNHIDVHGMTPLNVASYHEYQDVVRALTFGLNLSQ